MIDLPEGASDLVIRTKTVNEPPMPDTTVCAPSITEIAGPFKVATPDAREHILQFFAFDHLPPHLRAISMPFAQLAVIIVGADMPEGTPTQFPLPRNPERTVALRKLLEAKDAAVRAALAK